MTAALVGPAVSQQMAPSKTPLDLQYEKERIEQRANEQAYNEQMKRLKSQTTTKADPWAGVRPAENNATSTTNAKR